MHGEPVIPAELTKEDIDQDRLHASLKYLTMLKLLLTAKQERHQNFDKTLPSFLKNFRCNSVPSSLAEDGLYLDVLHVSKDYLNYMLAYVAIV